MIYLNIFSGGLSILTFELDMDDSFAVTFLRLVRLRADCKLTTDVRRANLL